MRGLLLSAGIVAFGAACGGAQAQRVYVPAGRWTVDGGNVRCSLARRLGDATSPILLLSSYLGRDEPQFILMRDGTQPLPPLPSRVTVTLSPGAVTEEVRASRRQGQTSDAFMLEGLAEGFFDRFAGAESISFSRGDRTYFTLATPQAASAVRVLRNCNDVLLRSWGVDTALRDSWQKAPEKIAGSINAADYPGLAIARGQTGVTVTLIRIELDGRISRCTVVVPSGTEVLDTTSCRLMTARFRYHPAVDAQGHPTAAAIVQTITWSMPQ